MEEVEVVVEMRDGVAGVGVVTEREGEGGTLRDSVSTKKQKKRKKKQLHVLHVATVGFFFKVPVLLSSTG